MSAKPTRAWIRPVLKPVRPVLREVLVMSLFVNLLALAVPVFVLQVYDRVVFHAGLSTLQGLVIGMALVLAFDLILRQSRARVMQTVGLKVDVAVSRRLFEKFSALTLPALESRPAAYWQALFRDIDVIRNAKSGAAAVLLTDLPFALLFLGLILVIAWPVAWVLLVILPLFLLIAWRSGAVMAKAGKAARDSALARDGLIAEMVSGRATVKALALDGAMKPKWEDLQAANIERSVERGRRTDTYANLGTSLTLLTTVSLTTVGAFNIIHQELTIGALIATNMLAGRLLGPLNQLVSQWRTYSAYRDAVKRLGEVFAMDEDRTEGAVSLDRPEGRLALEDVTFTYGGATTPVLDGIRATFGPGGVHALVGRNGTGKTTLLKLIQGLYRPEGGRVTLDGADIGQFTRRELAAWMGYVPQDGRLFQGSLRDNIALRLPDADDAAIVAAAQAAGAHDFIIDLPAGYATDIGEAGRRLSAGQRQRIAIARALLGDPPVLLLDEPSSDLDRHAELDLRRTLRAIGETRTVLVVTHSPILLGACDTLVAIDKGRVILSGDAKALLPRLFGARPAPTPAAEPEPAPEPVPEPRPAEAAS